MTPQASDSDQGRFHPRPDDSPQEPSLPERLLQALGVGEMSSRAGGQPAGLIGRLRSSGAAVRSAAPDSLNPGQVLMNRLRPSRVLEKAADQELRPLGFGLYGAIRLADAAASSTSMMMTSPRPAPRD